MLSDSNQGQSFVESGSDSDSNYIKFLFDEKPTQNEKLSIKPFIGLAADPFKQSLFDIVTPKF